MNENSKPARPGPGRLTLYLAAFPGLAVALNGYIFASGAADWSATLANPDWAPEGWVIGLVWTGLFTLMAISLWLVDRARERVTGQAARTPARAGLMAQYGVSIAWTFLYFGLQNVANGFYVTVAAFALGVPVIWLASRASLIAALLLLPLQAWLGFALALSYRVWRLNA